LATKLIEVRLALSACLRLTGLALLTRVSAGLALVATIVSLDWCFAEGTFAYALATLLEWIRSCRVTLETVIRARAGEAILNTA